MPLRILLADDHEIVRRGLVALFDTKAGWEVCGEASDGRQTVEKAQELRPDVVVLDIGMPSLNGLETTRLLKKMLPQTKVLILTLHESEQLIREVLDAGAMGFLLKSDAARDLVTAVDSLRQNRAYFTTRVASMVLSGYLNKNGAHTSAAEPERLTSRERQVVQLLAEGKSSKEVAVSLNLSVKTAETHRSNIMRKLGLHSVSEVVLYAVRNNIVQVPQLSLEQQ